MRNSIKTLAIAISKLHQENNRNLLCKNQMKYQNISERDEPRACPEILLYIKPKITMAQEQYTNLKVHGEPGTYIHTYIHVLFVVAGR